MLVNKKFWGKTVFASDKWVTQTGTKKLNQSKARTISQLLPQSLIAKIFIPVIRIGRQYQSHRRK